MSTLWCFPRIRAKELKDAVRKLGDDDWVFFEVDVDGDDRGSYTLHVACTGVESTSEGLVLHGRVRFGTAGP